MLRQRSERCTMTATARAGVPGEQIMKYFACFGIASCLICNAWWFAKSNLLSVGQNQQEPAATTSSQKQVPSANGDQTGLPSSAFGLAKVCAKNNPPPCATPPRQVFSPRPEFTSAARNAHLWGTCLIGAIVKTNGHTSHVRVLDSLGMGLDEKAIAAVKRWKFKPAMQDGKPVPVEIQVEVYFPPN